MSRQAPDIETPSTRDRYGLILLLALPALAENLLSTLVSMVDTMMVSSYSSTAVAAVGLVMQPRMLIISVFMSVGVGCTALISRAKGMNDPDKANRILMQTLLMTLGVTVLVMGLMLFLDKPLLRLLSGTDLSEETLSTALVYFRIQVYGIPLIAFTNVINAAMRGVGNTKIAFYTNSIANIVNIFINYCLIGGHLGFPSLGVAGASIATVIGQGAALAGCLYVLFRGKQFIRFNLYDAKTIDPLIMRNLAKVAGPALFEQIIMRIGMMIFTRIATSLGELDYSIHIIAMNIQSLSITTGIAFGIAAGTLTGQSLGRKNPTCARQLIRQTLHINLIVSMVVSLVLIFFGRQLASLYSTDPYVQDTVAYVLRIVALLNPLSNARFVYNYALRGAGDSRYTALSTMLGIMIARPVMAYLLVNLLGLGLTGLWIALTFDAVICWSMGIARWRKGHWDRIQLGFTDHPVEEAAR